MSARLRSRRSTRPTNRRGGTFTQVLACIVAVGGGCWLGAQYTGVEVGDLAYTALDETELLDKIPDDWRPTRSDCPAEGCPEPQTDEERAARLHEELTRLRQEAAVLRKSADLDLNSTLLLSGAVSDSNATVRREQTLGYWAGLSEIASEVAQLEASVQLVMKRETLGHVFDLRRRTYEYATRAIRAIPFDQADPQAVEAGKRLADWYRSGAEFYKHATNVWDSRAGGGQATSAEVALDKSREQHRKESELVRAKLAELNSTLSRRYGAAFQAISI